MPFGAGGAAAVLLPSKYGQKWDLSSLDHNHLPWAPRNVTYAGPDALTLALSPAAGGAAPVVLPSKDGQKWTPEEVVELTRLVEDPAYLKERLGLDKVRAWWWWWGVGGCCTRVGCVF